MRSIIIFGALISTFYTYSQKPSDELIYRTILDTLVNLKKFEFYNYKLEHIETGSYLNNPFDTIILFECKFQ